MKVKPWESPYASERKPVTGKRIVPITPSTVMILSWPPEWPHEEQRSWWQKVEVVKHKLLRPSGISIINYFLLDRKLCINLRSTHDAAKFRLLYLGTCAIGDEILRMKQ